MRKLIEQSQWLALALILAALPCVALAGRAEPAGEEAKLDPKQPLHARIDQHVARAAIGPVAGPADDAAFLRRVYLDLTGTIPSADQVRAFLADASPNKRAAVIDELLASPRYAQHLADVFDVMIMERRRGTHVKDAEWRPYLVKSFAANKPYDKLVREILLAHGADAKSRGPAAFYLNREAEPHLLTRDLGRVFLGRDMQCAQCHDHPNVLDYRQKEYYGIFAFLNRTSLFTNPKKVAMLAEKADGEVTYQSVFNPKVTHAAVPVVLDAGPIDEPALAKGKEYKVKPAKNVRSVATFSRREQLASEIVKPRAFSRNIVNRLWAHMLGRGLVDPVDMHHAGNPPTHPELLDELGDTFVASGYDVKAFVRQVALSETYQRALELPDDMGAGAAQLVQQMPSIKAQRQQLKDKLGDSFNAFIDAEADAQKAAREASEVAGRIAGLQKQAADARKAVDAASKALGDAEAAVARARKLHEAIAAATEKAKQAAAMANDSAVKQATDLLATRKDHAAGQVKSLADATAKKETAFDAANKKYTASQAAADEMTAKLDEAKRELHEKEKAFDAALAARNAHRSALSRIERQLEEMEALIELHGGANSSNASADQHVAPDDHATASVKALTGDAAPKLSRRLVVRPLKPLSPEQLSWAMMKATGVVDANRRAARAELEKKAADAAKKATAEARKKDKDVAEFKPAEVTAAQIEALTRAKLAGAVNQFVDLFAPAGGQPQDGFFATVDQALYFANAGTVRGWLNPSGDNLTARLNKLTDAKPLAEQMYLSVLSRMPSDEEIADVKDYLAGHEKDRTTAIGEMCWALLTSAEFRFCR